MLAIAAEHDDTFQPGKVVADFGRDPRGGLEWTASATRRIGIDVLAGTYRQAFDLMSHKMEYVNSTETSIPLEAGSVDLVYSVNAMDRVDNFDAMCSELLPILRLGGEFIGSFNLHEPPTPCEPQTLDEEIIKKYVLNRLLIRSYRVASEGPEAQRYEPFWDNKPVEWCAEAFFWVRASKPI